MATISVTRKKRITFLSLDVCSYNKKNEPFLGSLITDSEKWITYEKIIRKRHFLTRIMSTKGAWRTQKITFMGNDFILCVMGLSRLRWVLGVRPVVYMWELSLWGSALLGGSF